MYGVYVCLCIHAFSVHFYRCTLSLVCTSSTRALCAIYSRTRTHQGASIYIWLFCMYVYMHIHVHAHTRISLYVRVCSYLDTYKKKRYKHVLAHKFMLHAHSDVNKYINTCRSHTRNHTHTHTHTHSNIHAYTQGQAEGGAICSHRKRKKKNTNIHTYIHAGQAEGGAICSHRKKHTHTHTHKHTYIHTYMQDKPKAGPYAHIGPRSPHGCLSSMSSTPYSTPFPFPPL